MSMEYSACIEEVVKWKKSDAVVIALVIVEQKCMIEDEGFVTYCTVL